MPCSLIKILFPDKCFGCGIPGDSICANCIISIPNSIPSQRAVFPVYIYRNRIVRKAIHSLKYKKQSALAKKLLIQAASDITFFLSDKIMSPFEQKIYLIPIPLYRSRLAFRGFNQSKYLSKIISRNLAGSKVLNALKKIRRTDPQTKKNLKERLKNVQKSMKSLKLDPDTIYVVVDDVYTTGATFAEAKRALTEAGARFILFISLAHG